MSSTDQNDDDLRAALERDTDGSLAYELTSHLTQQAARWQLSFASASSDWQRADAHELAEIYSKAIHVLDIVAPRLRRN